MSDSPSKRSSSLPRCFSRDILSKCGPGVEPARCRRQASRHRRTALVPRAHNCVRALRGWAGCLRWLRGCVSIRPPADQWDGLCAPVTGRSVGPILIWATRGLFPADWPQAIWLTKFQRRTAVLTGPAVHTAGQAQSARCHLTLMDHCCCIQGPVQKNSPYTMHGKKVVRLTLSLGLWYRSH